MASLRLVAAFLSWNTIKGDNENEREVDKDPDTVKNLVSVVVLPKKQLRFDHDEITGEWSDDGHGLRAVVKNISTSRGGFPGPGHTPH